MNQLEALQEDITQSKQTSDALGQIVGHMEQGRGHSYKALALTRAREAHYWATCYQQRLENQLKAIQEGDAKINTPPLVEAPKAPEPVPTT